MKTLADEYIGEEVSHENLRMLSLVGIEARL